MAEYINVTTLNLLAKQVLEQCEPLNNLIVCGEVSNFTRHYKKRKIPRTNTYGYTNRRFV